MKRLAFPLLLLVSCATPPTPRPEAAPTAPAQPLGTGRVSATALNVRADATVDAEVLTTVRRGTVLTLLEERAGWYRVRLASGSGGWVSARYVSLGAAAPQAARGNERCPPDSDYAFEEAPTPRFSDRDAHGLVVVEATVSARGNVTSTRVVSNATGDPALAALTEQEIRSARFIPPTRNCVPRSFIFTYKRAF